MALAHRIAHRIARITRGELLSLSERTAGHDPTIIAPAEVEP